LYDHFYNQEQVSPSIFQFLRENPLRNLALVESMQNKMAAMRKVARDQV
jgi:hypothetical protein